MNLPPGPRRIFDLLEVLKKRKRNPIQLYEDIFRQYGDIASFRFGPYCFVMLNDADAIEQVLQTDSKVFTKSTGYDRFKLILGNGLLVSEGDVWRKQRRLVSWAFSTKHIERIHNIMVQETLELTKNLKTKKNADLAEVMNLVTLQIISVSLFGKSQISGASDMRDSLKHILEYLQTTRHFFIQFFLWPFPIKNKKTLALKIETSLPLPSTKRFLKGISAIDRLVAQMIEERKDKTESENLLDAMIQATDSEDQSKMDPVQLRDEVMTMLIAGHETTANALTWTWHQLLKHPEVYKKAKDEISSVINGEAPSFSDLPKLVYTRAVLEESMRLFPPFWRISRKNAEPIKIKNFDIPAGSSVIASIYNIQRNPKHWDHPNQFRPERFLNEKRSNHRYAYIPFGAGPRACVGSQFAIFEALTILAIYLKHFEFEKNFANDPEYFVSLTLQPKNGCPVIIKQTLGGNK